MRVDRYTNPLMVLRSKVAKPNAPRGTRTLTLEAPDPKSGVSTYSTMSAYSLYVWFSLTYRLDYKSCHFFAVNINTIVLVNNSIFNFISLRSKEIIN